MPGRPRRRAALAPRPLGRQGESMPYPLVHCQARHTVRATLVGTTTVALAAALGLGTAPAFAAQLGPLTKVSDGDPFAKCKADNVAKQEKSSGQRVWPNSEVETFVAADPSNLSRLIAAFQQDRWTDGAARGLVAGVSRNGGTGWKETIPPGNSKCSGGPFDRSTDPWVSIGPNGVAYFMSLVLDANPQGTFTTSGMQVNRSTDGGLTWGKPVSLILDTDPQLLDDKNSIT